MFKKIFLIVLIITTFTVVKAETIPQIYLYGDISNMNSKDDIREVEFKYKGTNNFDGYAKIKIQGTSSIAYDKKNYTINLFSNKDFTKKAKVNFAWGNQSKYCLKANWIDKTHARNIVTARLASEIQKKYNLFKNTPNYGLIDGYPVEMYINDEFLGLYTLNIPKDAWMFNMDEENPNHIVLAGDAWADSVFFKKEATWNGEWSLEVGQENDETLEKLNRVIRFVKDSSDEEFKKHINEYINLDALINYYIIMEFGYLADNAGKNMLFVTYDGKIWYPSLYDLDTSFGTDYTGFATWDYNSLITDANLLFLRLKTNFSSKIGKRYFELRKKILTKEHILELFNDFEKTIPSETFDKEQKRWANIPGYDISQIEEFLDVRIPFLDDYMREFTKQDNKEKMIIIIGIGLLITSAIVCSIGLKKHKNKALK